MFAILGLLIAFTFSGALTRFDVRRAQIVDEANAIGTGHLRIDVLPSGAQPRLRQAFRDYVDARNAINKKLPDLQAAHNELMRSQELQADIWAQAVVASRKPDSRPGTEGLVLPAHQRFEGRPRRFELRWASTALGSSNWRPERPQRVEPCRSNSLSE